MASWGCPHEVEGRCQRVNDLPCDLGMKGCVLFGRFRFADPAKNRQRKPATHSVQTPPRLAPSLTITTHSSALDLVYCDEFMLVVKKPAGLLCVPGLGADKQDCLSTRLQRDYPDTLVVHRLDMATSGLVLFARGAQMQRRLSQMFRERAVRKRYIALVEGLLDPQGVIDLPIAADWPNRPLRIIDHSTGKASLTHFRLLSYDSLQDISRVELEPFTGRTHQLRVHLAAIAHPIMGDALYGGRNEVRLFLHATGLQFEHPVSAALLDFVDPPVF